MQNINKYWHGIVGLFGLYLGVVSLGFDAYPQFPTMCIILGIILALLIESMDPIPPLRTYHWHTIWDEMRRGQIVWWR